MCVDVNGRWHAGNELDRRQDVIDVVLDRREQGRRGSDVGVDPATDVEELVGRECETTPATGRGSLNDVFPANVIVALAIIEDPLPFNDREEVGQSDLCFFENRDCLRTPADGLRDTLHQVNPRDVGLIVR
jgi:hypothetical protein